MPADIQSLESRRTSDYIVGGWNYGPTFRNSAFYNPRPSAVWSVNSGEFGTIVLDIEGDDFRYHSIKQVIALEREYREHEKENTSLRNRLVKQKVKNFRDVLLDLRVDKISSQMSFDNSILYSFLKNGKKGYIHYFLEQEDDEDEVVFSITEEGKTLINFGGNSEEALSELFSYFKLYRNPEPLVM